MWRLLIRIDAAVLSQAVPAPVAGRWWRLVIAVDGRSCVAPTRFLPAYDAGDHLHPNDAGMAAMALDE